MPQKERTVTISFRVSESAFKALQEEAKKRNVSLNTLANQLFVAFSEYDRFLDRFKMVKISTPTLKKIIDAATDDAIVAAGRTAGASVPESFILAKRGELSVDNAFEYLSLMGAHANLFDYTDLVHSGKNSVTLTHDLGEKGSLFLASYVESVFRSLGRTVKVIQFPDSITVEVRTES